MRHTRHRGTSKSQDRRENHNGSDLQRYGLTRAVWSLFRTLLEYNIAAQWNKQQGREHSLTHTQIERLSFERAPRATMVNFFFFFFINS